jgi:hypothetical protein
VGVAVASVEEVEEIAVVVVKVEAVSKEAAGPEEVEEVEEVVGMVEAATVVAKEAAGPGVATVAVTVEVLREAAGQHMPLQLERKGSPEPYPP